MTEIVELSDQQRIAQLTPVKSRRILDTFTPRQTDVMERYARFRQRNEIAAELGISDTMVGKHLANVREKFGVSDRASATMAFFVARYQCDEPVLLEKNLSDQNQVIERFVADRRLADLNGLLTSKVFQDFVKDSRSHGPRALDAWFGRGWRPGAIILAALIPLVLVAAALYISDYMTNRIDPSPSSPTLETTPMNEKSKAQKLSNGFHAIEAQTRALQKMIADQTALASEVADEAGLSAFATSRTMNQLAAANTACTDVATRIGLSHVAAEKAGEPIRADIPWSCPEDAELAVPVRLVANNV